MKEKQYWGEHAELLVLPDGRVLAHNITPDIAEILTILNPKNELMARRAGLFGDYEDSAGD